MDSIAMFDNNYECDVYQPEDFPTVESTPQEAIFLFYLFSETPIIRSQILIMLQQHLLSGHAYWSTTFSSYLTALNVPYHAHPSIIQKITDNARAAANEVHNMDCKIIPLVATIKAESYNINEEAAAIAEAVTGSSNGQVLNLVPASNSLIKALKKIKIEGCSEKCVICLEDMEVGSKAAAMPCLHIYHQDCLVNWLKISNLCPLCRFPMP